MLAQNRTPPLTISKCIKLRRLLDPLSLRFLPCALAILLALAGAVAAQESGFSGNTCNEEGANCQTEADWKFGWCEAAVEAGVFIGTADQCVQPGGGGGYLAASRQNENAAADQGGGSSSSSKGTRSNTSTASRSGSASTVQVGDTENTQADVEVEPKDDTENTRRVVIVVPIRVGTRNDYEQAPKDETNLNIPAPDLCSVLGIC